MPIHFSQFGSSCEFYWFKFCFCQSTWWELGIDKKKMDIYYLSKKIEFKRQSYLL